MNDQIDHVASKLDQAKLEFEREKWRVDTDFRQQELELRKREATRSRWINPLVIAVFAAAAAASGNTVVSFISSYKQSQLEREKAGAAQSLEQTKSEAARILEVVKTNDPDKAAINLRFLLDAGLIADELTREKIAKYLDSRAPGSGVSLPSTPPTLSALSLHQFACSIQLTSAVSAAELVKQAFSSEPFGLIESDVDSQTFLYASRSHTSQLFVGYRESVSMTIVVGPAIVRASFLLLLSNQHSNAEYFFASDAQNSAYQAALIKRLTERVAQSTGSPIKCAPVMSYSVGYDYGAYDGAASYDLGGGYSGRASARQNSN